MENFKIFKQNNRFFLLFIIVFCIFVLGKNVLALNYTQNFDDFSKDQPISDVIFWEEQTVGLATISTTTSVTNPNSVIYNGAYTAGNVYFYNETYNLENSSIYVRNSATHPASIKLQNGSSGKGIALTFDSGDTRRVTCSTATSSYYVYFTYNWDTNWHKFTWERTDLTHESLYIDDVLKATCFVNDVLLNWLNINGQNGGTYLDNFNISNAAPTPDAIEFINPEENGIYNYSAPITSPNYFNWHTHFSFSTTTVALYGSDYPVVSISFEKTGSFTPTIFEMYGLYLTNIRFFAEEAPEEASFQDNNISNFPAEDGDYTVIATLYNSYYSNGQRILDNILATAEIDKFTITSATSTTPTAWCSGLCNDIATATDLLGEIGNGVNCALRSAACYLFYPHDFSINGVLDQAAIIQTKFPASTYFDLTNAIASATESTTYENSSFGFPAARKTGTSTEFYIIPVISSSTLADYVGTTNANNIRLGFTTFLYCLTGILILFILI